MPPATDDYEAEIQRNARWNFAVNLGDLSFVSLAGSFVFISTILPLYASHLTDSRALIGLVPAIYVAASHLPQLFMARRAEAMGRNKPWIVKVSVFERAPWLLLALGVLLWPSAPAWVGYGLLLLVLTIAQGAAGVANPAWRAMLAKVIHPDRKGMLFGMGLAIGGLMGAVGALLARYILENVAFPTSFGLCFLLAFVGQAISWGFLTLNREPAAPVARSKPPLLDYLRELPGILRSDRSFARFLGSQLLVTVGTLGVPFFIIYGQSAFGISDGFAASLTMASLITQSLGTPVLGWVGDRFGHKRAAEVSALLCALAGAIVLVAPNAGWLYAAFAVLTLADAGSKVSRASLAMDLGAHGRVPTYVALATTLLAGPALLVPVAGGWLIDLFDFRPVFLIGVVMAGLGWLVIRAGVVEPRK
jgi:MFS family permease